MAEDRMKRDVKRDEDAQNKGGNYTQKVSIDPETPNIIRLVDMQRGCENYERYFVSWIVCDNGEKGRFVVKNDFEGSSILAEIIGDRDNFYRGGILETIKDDDGKKSSRWYSREDPEIMDLVMYNGDRSGNKGDWKYKATYDFNCIDRRDTWCKDNKKCKVISMGSQAFESLVDTRDSYGALDEYDVNYKKTGSGKHGTRHSITQAGPVLKQEGFPIVTGPLTEEEKSYERWDLKKEAQLTSATEILSALRNNIKRISAVMGIDWIQKLEAQAQIEKGMGVSSPTPAPTPESPKQEVPRIRGEITPPTLKQPETGTSKPLVKCKKCGKDVPEGTVDCPFCGFKMLLPCANCGFLFDSQGTECPSCHTIFKVG